VTAEAIRARPAPIAKTEAQESKIDKQHPGSQVSIGAAAHFLGIPPFQVIMLCKWGVLPARRNRHGTWRLDEAFLIRWREAHLHARAAGCESIEGEEQSALPGSAAPPGSAERAPCPPGACEAHWERRGRIVPEFRANLCSACHAGRPLPARADEGAP
jgi:hypothetical protein